MCETKTHTAPLNQSVVNICINMWAIDALEQLETPLSYQEKRSTNLDYSNRLIHFAEITDHRFPFNFL